ncbi:uncharacterized protein B0I36DRAFT_15453 [Microdochium trichocladiopsis]|uniref:Secreted protein n=1 Tax=Microdochium trichocladiopsis TaxID=1682393 RepID=A0A9P9BUA6_9PEZI|nr:uncharacterized protein B0I36DRAFT_15453 [Microdochium trichocladiopsis]KAH7040796.1 hypothetical protein B0I36DRAFT_15453 [Microdochium trichocladiopsis]
MCHGLLGVQLLLLIPDLDVGPSSQYFRAHEGIHHVYYRKVPRHSLKMHSPQPGRSDTTALPSIKLTSSHLRIGTISSSL